MLEPYGRMLLLDTLRPPEGFAFDEGIGTTYSLDLLALLNAPLAFTFFDRQDSEGQLAADSLAILESLRRYASKLTVFCHAGRIIPPAKRYPQFAYLEEMVVECLPPDSRGAFHAKLWLLRFTGPDGAVVYRMLCLTRNLTFDRSWDTVLALEGRLLDRQKGIAANRPLADFVRALGGRATHGPVSEAIRARLDRVAEEVRRVVFELPDGFDEIRFWPIGIEGYSRWPFPSAPDRVLIISPFLTETCLSRLTGEAKERVLVSRPESLATLRSQVAFDAVYVLSDRTEPEPIAEEVPARDAQEDGNLTGLHAKCYVMDEGWRSRVWTGSANATAAAFRQNVEFLVELGGQRSQMGVRVFLESEQGKTHFRDLLVPFAPPAEQVPPDPVLQALEEVVEAIRGSLIASAVLGRVNHEAEDQFSLSLIATHPEKLELPQGANIRCWPITISEECAVQLSSSEPTLAVIPHLSMEGLSAFLGVEVIAHAEGKQFALRFVLRIPLEGVPGDRRERLLRSFLRNEESLSRYLLLLLAEESEGAGITLMGEGVRTHGESRLRTRRSLRDTLFESLLLALDRAPERLDSIAKAFEDLAAGTAQVSGLPPRFEEIWQPIWEARKRMKK